MIDLHKELYAISPYKAKSIEDDRFRDAVDRIIATADKETKKPDEEFFTCLRLSRDDFRRDGLNPDSLTDEAMQHFANDIGDNCMDTFWNMIARFASSINLPRQERHSLPRITELGFRQSMPTEIRSGQIIRDEYLIRPYPNSFNRNGGAS